MAKEKKKSEIKLNKYEKARILGSRALQISMGAPFLIKLSKKDLEELNYDPLLIAEKEMEEGDIPITEDISSRTISLPLFPSLTEEQIKSIAKVIEKVISFYSV